MMATTKLKQARQKAGYTQNSIAKSVGLSRVGYQNYEQDLRLPDVKTALRIASTLDTTVEALWGEAPASAQ